MKSPKEKDEADFVLTLPTLTLEPLDWLGNALEIVHPKHEWVEQLSTAL